MKNRMGLEISRLRKEIGLSQKQFGKLIGVNEKFIIEVEAGRKVIGSELLIKVNKVLRKEVGKLDIYEEDVNNDLLEPSKDVVKVIEKPVQAIWNDALSGVIMSVPIYDYSMDKAYEYKKMPIIANKVEGFSKDNVMFLKIQDDDMCGFKIFKGDRAFSYKTSQIDTEGFYLVEFEMKRFIRKIKKIEREKVLMLSYCGKLSTQTLMIKDVKIIAKLIWIERNLYLSGE